MQVRRLAVFGGSHVRNLSDYYPRHGPVFRVRFFFKPDMKARLIPKDEWKALLEWRPSHVLFILGENDIRSGRSTLAVNHALMYRVRKLQRRRVKALVVGILPRARFLGDARMTYREYEKRRKRINRCLDRRLRKKFYRPRISMFNPDGSYHEDYCRDRVHLSDHGNAKLMAAVDSAFIWWS